MKKEKANFIEQIVKRGIYGVSALIIGSGVMMMAPMTMAETAGSATSDINVTLTPVISLGVYSDSTLETTTDSVTLMSGSSSTITPTADGAWASNSAYVGVATNNATGYTLKMTMGSDATSTALLPETSGVSTNIAATESAVSSDNIDNMVKDHWGYIGGSVTDYTAPVLAANLSSAPAIATTTGPNTTSNSVPVTFGAKISTDMVSGIYSNTVMFTAVANSGS